LEQASKLDSPSNGKDNVMAFVVQCPFCKLRARVPHRANGANGKCPRCANSFTLAPADDQVLHELPVGVGEASAAAGGDAGALAGPRVAVAIAQASAAKLKRSAPVAAPDDADSLPDYQAISPGPARRRRTGAAAGVVALLAAGSGLLCASMPALCG